ncbi:energy-coupling factor transport system permease protein [Granulicatella balaenopterae]|uniref:Energy-coupling factor transport system permease protein n=1 Tax=Granulicatella balaenopterae TaxID=137733 RepID=A0A1H9MIK7_9LACT|nr:CbiQ family ECF transporter T component [Granulicatella balaenopterae]SER23488.1 energy-coupling factor transport system permease protein [Granulicatella balaenopterae]
MNKKSYQLPLAISLLVMAFELAFVKSVMVNVFVIGLTVLYFLLKRQYRSVIALALVPLLPALANYWSFYLHATDPSVAIIYLTRTYAYAALGLFLALGIDLEELLLVLEQKGMPANFVYGLLVVVHAVPMILQEVDAVSKASVLRGKKLYIWSPMFYVKAIMTSFLWSKQYTTAMRAHGYQENAVRTHYITYKAAPISLGMIGLVFITFQIIVYLYSL